MYCERCNIDFPESLRYCKWCGQHLTRRAQATTHIRRCHSCGHAVKGAWSYCRSCGAELGGVVQADVICSGCGQVVEPPGLICRVCGLEVQQEGDPDADLVAALDSGPVGYAYCASCGVRLDPQTNRCPKCGLPVTKRQLISDVLQTCPICQTQNRRGTGICSGCGAALSSGAATGGNLVARASGGPTTLPDVPVGSSSEAGDSAHPDESHLKNTQAKPSGTGEAEAPTVSYTEILSSWTPEQASSERAGIVSEAAANQVGQRVETAGEMIGVEGAEDEFKTNVMQAVELTDADSAPTEALSTGSLPGSRPTSVFGASELPFEALTATENAQAQERVSASDETGISNDDWVVTAHEFQGEKEPVQPPEATVPILPGSLVSSPDAGSTGVSERPLEGPPSAHPGPATAGQSPGDFGGVAPDSLLPTGLTPPIGDFQVTEPILPVTGMRVPTELNAPGRGLPFTEGGTKQTVPPPGIAVEEPRSVPPSMESTPPLASIQATGQPAVSTTPTDPITTSGQAVPDLHGTPNPPLPGAHSRQVPPEVAHYMAYMDRQSAPQMPRTEPQQSGQAPKSRLLMIALVTGCVAIVVLTGLGYLIFRFQRSRTSSVIRPTPIEQTSPANDVPAPTPEHVATPTAPEAKAAEGMVMVAAGTYIIGRDDGEPLAGPKHTALLSSFFIDKTEVTNAEYKRFVDATGHAAPATWRERAFGEGKANYPVTDVTWQDATDYAAWAGKRLPTEAEWEAAARGSSGAVYPWGDEWRSDAANIGTSGIAEVGRFPEGASACGALDMIGNVWEWTADEFKLYPGNSARLRDLVEPGVAYRVIRGGAYDGSKKNDASYRGYVDGSKGYPKTGFRCVRNAEKP